jgi:Acyl-CoA thioesterase
VPSLQTELQNALFHSFLLSKKPAEDGDTLVEQQNDYTSHEDNAETLYDEDDAMEESITHTSKNSTSNEDNAETLYDEDDAMKESITHTSKNSTSNVKCPYPGCEKADKIYAQKRSLSRHYQSRMIFLKYLSDNTCLTEINGQMLKSRNAASSAINHSLFFAP